MAVRKVHPSPVPAQKSADRILAFLEQDWGKRYPANDDFGQGSASERFVEIMGQDTFWQAKLQKVFADHA
jgi:hypothetical protein